MARLREVGTNVLILDDRDSVRASIDINGVITGVPGAATVLPPGYSFGVDLSTGSAVASTVQATPTTIVPGSTHVFDGGQVWVSFYFPLWQCAASGNVFFSLWEGAVEVLPQFAILGAFNGGINLPPLTRWPFTPAAGPHTYKLTAFKGSAFTATYSPGYLAFSKI